MAIDLPGITQLVIAVTAMLGVVLPFVLVILKRIDDMKKQIKETHDLVNGMSESQKLLKEEADLAKGALAGIKEERENPMVSAAQARPQPLMQPQSQVQATDPIKVEIVSVDTKTLPLPVEVVKTGGTPSKLEPTKS